MISDTFLKPPANPGANATAVLYDSTLNETGSGISPGNKSDRRAAIAAFLDQNATLKISFKTNGSTNWRPYNGTAGAGDTITANTPFTQDYLLYGDDIKIEIDTVTAPTVWEVSCRLSPGRAP
ncbi:MAG TPA: hypothetical protein VHG72_21870 [Polyangia bacterium]|nr:hypothetical protein [Polyangia bacterium]